MTTDTTPFYTAQQIANLAGVHVTYAQRARRTGEIIAAKSTLERDKKNSLHVVYWYAAAAADVLRAMKGRARSNKLNRVARTEAIKECREPHLLENKALPVPYRCVKHDLPDACRTCRQTGLEILQQRQGGDADLHWPGAHGGARA